MARIILGSYMVRYPLGGVLSSSLQWLVGFQRLGHEVYFVEKSGYPNSCYDPERNVKSDDCSYGVRTVHALLSRFDLEDRWCYVDAGQRCHGMSEAQLGTIFRSTDVFVDRGAHGTFQLEAAGVKCRVLVDGEPAATQMKMEARLASGETLPEYDFYYTVGRNIGTAKCPAPAAGKQWRPLFHPVVVDLFPSRPPTPGAPFTTVSNWQAHAPMEFQGVTYGQKDREFDRFLGLPGRTSVPLELAVSGKGVPTQRLVDSGWRLRDAHQVTVSFDSYREYLGESRGEFSVAKHVFVATNSGWFSDRSAAYLASGRPVVLQETGFSAHLPCGEGLFAVRTAEEAAAAIEQIEADYRRHSRRAREIALEYLDAGKVLAKFLDEIGV